MQLLFCKKVKLVPKKVGLFQESLCGASPLLVACVAGLRLPPASSPDMLWSSASKNLPAAAFPVPLPSGDPVIRLSLTSRVCAVAFLETSASFLPALLEKCACMGVHTHLYLGLGEFGDAVSCPSSQKKHNSTSGPCAMQGMLLARSFWVVPFTCPCRVTSSMTSQWLLPAFCLRCRACMGPAALFASARWGARGWGSGLVQWLLLHLPDMCK